MARRPDARAVKRNRTYSADEAARTTGVATVTVRRWLKAGLRVVSARKPALILGDDLLDFLRARKPAKQRCRPPECYCLKCRAPRAPAFGEVEIVPINTSSGNMRALCGVCATIMYKRVPFASLPMLKADFGLIVTLVRERLDEPD